MHDDQISSLIRMLEERLSQSIEETRRIYAELQKLRGTTPRKEPRVSKYIWTIIRDAQQRRFAHAELEKAVYGRASDNLHFYSIQRIRQSISQMLNAQTLEEDSEGMIGPGPKFWDNPEI